MAEELLEPGDLDAFAQFVNPLFERVAQTGKDEYQHIQVRPASFSMSLKAAASLFRERLTNKEEADPVMRVLRVFTDMEMLFSEIALRIWHYYQGGQLHTRWPICCGTVCEIARFDTCAYDAAFDAAAQEFIRSFQRFLDVNKTRRAHI